MRAWRGRWSVQPFHCGSPGLACWGGWSVAQAGVGGAWVWWNRPCQVSAQGQCWGRRRVRVRAVWVMRAATWTSWRRMVPVVEPPLAEYQELCGRAFTAQAWEIAWAGEHVDRRCTTRWEVLHDDAPVSLNAVREQAAERVPQSELPTTAMITPPVIRRLFGRCRPDSLAETAVAGASTGPAAKSRPQLRDAAVPRDPAAWRSNRVRAASPPGSNARIAAWCTLPSRCPSTSGNLRQRDAPVSLLGLVWHPTGIAGARHAENRSGRGFGEDFRPGASVQ